MPDRHRTVATLRALHFWIGVGAIVAFLATGQLMYHGYDQLRGLADGPRLLFRSSHLYILLSAFPHLVLGLYLQPGLATRFWRSQWILSILLMLTTAFMFAGFFVEPHLTGLARPLTMGGAITGLAAGVVVVVLHWRNRHSPVPGKRARRRSRTSSRAR